jgi:hypothetical protein
MYACLRIEIIFVRTVIIVHIFVELLVLFLLLNPTGTWYPLKIGRYGYVYKFLLVGMSMNFYP